VLRPDTRFVSFIDGNHWSVIRVGAGGEVIEAAQNYLNPVPLPPPEACAPWGCGGVAACCGSGNVSWSVQGGYSYYVEFAGDIEHCNNPYLVSFAVPK
jgi:hypothetical protein